MKTALSAGYRHIDAAAVYDNEDEVGAGIKESEVDRKDIFVGKTRSGLYPIANWLTQDHLQIVEHTPQARRCRTRGRYLTQRSAD